MSLSYYQCAYIILNVFRTYTIYRFMHVFYEERRGKVWTEWLGYIVYYLAITLTYLLNGIPVIILLLNVFGLMALGLLYRTTNSIRLISAVSICFIFLVTETVVILITGFMNLGPFVPSPYKSIAGIVLIQIFTFLVEIICEQCKNIKKGGGLPYRYWIALILLPLTSLYILLQLIYVYVIRERTLLVLLGLLLLCNICVFYLIDLIVKQERERSKYLIEQKEVESIKKQMYLMQNSSDNIKEIRHDLKNHLYTIQNFNKKGESGEIQKYINTLLEQGDLVENYIRTGNITADGILNIKLMEAKKLEIEIITDIKIPIDVGIIPYDWTVILGNLLDNAIEASQKLCKEKRYIEIKIQYTKGMLLISIKNAFEGNIEYQDTYKTILKTSKKDKELHGIGLRHVRETIKRYNGELIINDNYQKFSAEIVLYV